MRYRFDGPLTHRPRSFAVKLLSAVLATVVLWTPALMYAQDPVPRESEYVYEDEVIEERHDGISDYEVDADGQPIGEIDPNLEDVPIEEGAPSTTPDPSAEPIALPTGTSASAATPQAISLPDAEGSVEGMGESFSPILSSGTATFSVPIAVAPGRAGVQPSLGLSYSSTAGNGPVGFGWNLGVPFISRQTDRGLPHYVDGDLWHEEEDRFMYNGGQELVPVDNADIAVVDQQAFVASNVAANLPAEVTTPIPWQQYRARVEGGFMRFFREPEGERWIVQSKDGTWFEFGLLENGPTDAVTASANAVERDPESSGVFRWCLTRMSDAHGSTVYYTYRQDDGRAYLEDIYYVSPATCASTNPATARQCNAPLDGYGAHVHLDYEGRDDHFAGYVSGWRIGTALRLNRIVVTAWEDSVSGRALVRRYHLRYDPNTFHSLLQQVQVEGRPNTNTCTAPGEACEGDPTVTERDAISGTVNGEMLPPMTFTYSGMPDTGDVVAGFGAIDSTVRPVTSSPPHSVDENRADLFDVNSDGLPDLIVTDPARYRTDTGEPAVGVFFNGFTGPNAFPAGAAATFSDAVPMAIPAGLSSVLSLNNANVVPMDIDGDGRSDLLHMPRLRTYGWWSPTRRADDPTQAPTVSPADQSWEWTYAQIDLPASDTDPRIDLGRDSSHMRALDVNNDHLIDIVRTTGTVMQTWLNLGWLPGGDGRFGSHRWDGSQWILSTEPTESCLLQGGTPIDFDDPEVRLGDMNGDGLQDLVQMRRGRVIYWPGRGDGIFGIGSRGCARGEGAGRYIEMSTPPMELSPELDNVYLSDVNMDGASDIVQVRFREIDVWFNRAGEGWTRRTIARGTPAAPGFAPRIRFADIDGSATTDIIWGNGGRWEFIDPTGGERPRLLVGVDNGLGANTEIAYESSALDYLTDLQNTTTCPDCELFPWSAPAEAPDARLCTLSGQDGTAACNASAVEADQDEWLIRSSGSPVISTVVRSVSTTDRFNVLGRAEQVSLSEFAYHDAYYEGIEQEFRGFGAADAVSRGDWNNPTVWSRTRFNQGRRPSGIADDRLAENPNEALKGREFMTEVFDEDGDYLSTSFATLTDRYLLTGLDGREIHYAFVSETNELRYDTTPFAPDGSTTLELSAVVRESVAAGVVGSPSVESTYDLVVRSNAAHTARIRSTFEQVDNVGGVHRSVAHGAVELVSGAKIDQANIALMTPWLLNDVGQWIHREWITSTTRAYADLAGGGPFGYVRHTYHPDGDVSFTAIIPNSSVPTAPSYVFGGEAVLEGNANFYTHASDIQYVGLAHDEWGQPLATCNGAGVYNNPTYFPSTCLRYGQVDYDTDFDQVVVEERIATDRNGGAPVYLRTTATWDRGLGAIRTAVEPNGYTGGGSPSDYTTSVQYDGLGRLTSVTAPFSDDCSTATPSTTIRYELTSSPSTQPLSRVLTTTELECDGTTGESGDTLTSIAYVDGLGRARAALATNNDGVNAWVRSGISTLDRKGSVRRSYQTDFYNGTDTDYRAVVALPSTPYAVTRYDAFGRARGVIAEDGSVTWTSYHSLSTDVCDPLDNDPSSIHYRTCTTAVTDGHGRVIDQILRNRRPSGVSETHRLWTYYRADGAVMALIRAQSTGARPATWVSSISDPHVVRLFTYDTLGRRLSSDDPDTDNPADSDQTTNSWRYLYNKVNDLVAVRDPRGCGQNFFYDHAGRLRGEQYVSCGEAQNAIEENPHADNTVGGLIAMAELSGSVDLDVVYHYDDYPGWATSPNIIPATARGTAGRATGVSDRGQRAVIAYDYRGQAVWTARQIALIPTEMTLGAIGTIGPADGRPTQTETLPTTASDVEYDEDHTYVRTATFDHAGRPETMTLPTDPDYGGGTAPTVSGALTYNARGLPSGATAQFGLDSQTIVEDIEYLRDGLVSSITYGDDENIATSGARAPTVSTTIYDARRRPVRMTTTRTPTVAGVGTHELDAVSTVFDQQLVWDAANNLTRQIDQRDPGEWPDGFRPQSVDISHDSLYRVIRADYEYTQADGSRTPADSATNWRTNFQQSASSSIDPMHPEPAAMATSSATDRVTTLAWDWDYLANNIEWTDDANQFYERSIGAIQNGNALEGSERPSALYLSTDIDEHGNGGWLEVDYGDGGNVRRMTVHAQCTERSGFTCAEPTSGSLDDRKNHSSTGLRASCDCALEQHYVYRWDELNRIVEARRYDGASGTGWTLEARQRYRYDGANQRVVKQNIDPASSGPERIALYPYPGDFERRGMYRDGVTGTYEPNAVSETQYVIAGARSVWRHDPSPLNDFDVDRRFVVPVSDLIQTSAAVFDVRSGALLEASTYYPNGGRETFLNDDSDLVSPEAAGFTGKEAEEEVGVTYFGERWLVARLGRWASADPLHVHQVGGGESLNSYHYVGGNLLAARDPLGLFACDRPNRLPPSDAVSLRRLREFSESYSAAGGIGRSMVSRVVNAATNHPQRMNVQSTTTEVLEGAMIAASYERNALDYQQGTLYASEDAFDDVPLFNGTLVHESFHAYVHLAELGQSAHDRRVRSFLAAGGRRFAQLESGSDMRDSAEVFQEAVALYVGRRAGAFQQARHDLSELEAQLASGEVTAADASSRLQEIRDAYAQSVTARQQWAYDSRTRRDGTTSIVQYRDAVLTEDERAQADELFLDHASGELSGEASETTGRIEAQLQAESGAAGTDG